jgi:uncharacterized membrane protein YqiK
VGERSDASPRQFPEKKHIILKNTGFADRLSTAAAARKAQLEKFEPKSTVTDPAFVNRQARRAAELEAVRIARAEQRATALQARADAHAAARAAIAKAELEVLEAKRLERKSRKTAQKVDANVRRQDRRDALQAYALPSS